MTKIKPQSPEFMREIAKLPRKCKNVKVTYERIAEAANCTKGVIIAAVKRKQLDPNNLRSIAYFIVQRTLECPKTKEEKE
jgi:hypothetical protein